MALQAYLGQSTVLPTHTHSPALNHMTSTFLSYALHFEHAKPSRKQAEKIIRDLKPVVKQLKMENYGAFEKSNLMRDPDHMMWAFRSLRTKQGKDGTGGEDDYELVEEFDDDEEKWGGERLLRVLKEQGGVDVMLVCVRWFGGDMIGPSRFQHIHTTAQTALTALQETLTLEPLRKSLRELDLRIQELRDALAFAKSNGTAPPSPPLMSINGSAKKAIPNYDKDKDAGKLERLVRAKTKTVEELEKKVAWEESLAVGEMGLMASSQEMDNDVLEPTKVIVNTKTNGDGPKMAPAVVIDLTDVLLSDKVASSGSPVINKSTSETKIVLPASNGTKRSAPDSVIDPGPSSKKLSPPSSLRATALPFTPAATLSGTASSSQAKASTSQPAVHSFFSNPPQASRLPAGILPSPSTLVHFVHLDPFVNMPSVKGKEKASARVIFFDMDGTLIKPRTGSVWPKSETDWMWLYPEVPIKLAEEVRQGRHVVVLSNQGSGREKLIKEWKLKLGLIAKGLPADTPIRILGALSNKSNLDKYRKPATGMIDFVKALYEEKGYTIDLQDTCYVGDAAGRVSPNGRPVDHSDCDLKLARNAGIPFMLPEEYFLGKTNVSYPDPPKGFRPAQLHIPDDLPMVVPSSLPVVGSNTKEIVLFVGLPASGKTTLFRNYFKQHGYEHINQDHLRSRDRCVRRATEVISAPGKQGCVIDNTNRDARTRKLYIDLAKKLKVPIRCFYFTCPEELARHNNAYRAFYGPVDEEVRSYLPGTAFSSFSVGFEMPEEEEGLREVRYVNFVFEGTIEQRRRWEGWMA